MPPKVWQGRTETLEDFKAQYDVTEVFWIEEFDPKLASLDPDTVYTFVGADVTIPETAAHDTTALRAALANAKTEKTEGEIAMSRAAADISVESHKTVMRHIR